MIKFEILRIFRWKLFERSHGFFLIHHFKLNIFWKRLFQSLQSLTFSCMGGGLAFIKGSMFCWVWRGCFVLNLVIWYKSTSVTDDTVQLWRFHCTLTGHNIRYPSTVQSSPLEAHWTSPIHFNVIPSNQDAARWFEHKNSLGIQLLVWERQVMQNALKHWTIHYMYILKCREGQIKFICKNYS